MNKKYYITTPIYYINDVPHIGHAYTSIAADVLARYHSAKKEEVFFLTGVDEHGAKIAEAAQKSGKTPKEFVDDLVPAFKLVLKESNVGNSEFFRTTNPEHEKQVQKFVAELVKRGLVEKRKYEGLYCVGCEKFLKNDELVDGMCPDHKRVPVKQSEENYFFKLSKFENKLLELIQNNEFNIGPDSRRNEILGKIKQGLEDISISRANVKWGIPFPGDEEQTIYVWVDALLNYYSATKIYNKEDFWPADLHLVGKDILWFHAVIWPAMLLALDLPLPKEVFANGYFTVGGQKMSKSLGNVLNPIAMIEKYGADAVRYALLREVPFGEDGDISEEKIALRYNSDLANGLGNLLNRTLNMINKYWPDFDRNKLNEFSSNSALSISADSFKDQFDNKIDKMLFSEVLAELWSCYIKPCNQLIDEKKPWFLVATDRAGAQSVLATAYINLIEISKYLEPFMPETAEKIKGQLKDLKPEILFPRI